MTTDVLYSIERTLTELDADHGFLREMRGRFQLETLNIATGEALLIDEPSHTTRAEAAPRWQSEIVPILGAEIDLRRNVGRQVETALRSWARDLVEAAEKVRSLREPVTTDPARVVEAA